MKYLVIIFIGLVLLIVFILYILIQIIWSFKIKNLGKQINNFVSYFKSTIDIIDL